MASQVLHGAAGSVSSSIAERWDGLRRRFAAAREQRRWRARISRELLTYTDRELADIGITRSDIPAIVAGTYRRS